jgi:HSP20 family protein
MFDLMPYRRHNRGLLNDFDRFFDSAMMEWPGVRGFTVDVQDCGDHFLLEADLPGATKDDVTLTLDGTLLTIHAEQNAETTEEDTHYIYKERSFGSCSRTFDVSGIKTDEISGKFKDGVLTLTLPKEAPEEDQPTTIDIEFED